MGQKFCGEVVVESATNVKSPKSFEGEMIVGMIEEELAKRGDDFWISTIGKNAPAEAATVRSGQIIQTRQANSEPSTMSPARPAALPRSG